MAHYTIDLPGNIHVNVHKGKVFKKRAGFFKQWPWVRIASEARVGYIVSIENELQKTKTEYHLVKTTEGAWPAGPGDERSALIRIQGKWRPLEDDAITVPIKKAIDDYENKQ